MNEMYDERPNKNLSLSRPSSRRVLLKGDYRIVGFVPRMCAAHLAERNLKNLFFTFCQKVKKKNYVKEKKLMFFFYVSIHYCKKKALYGCRELK